MKSNHTRFSRIASVLLLACLSSSAVMAFAIAPVV